MKLSDQFKRIFSHPFTPVVLAPFVLFSPLIFTGEALIWGTTSTQFFPWWNFAYGSLLQGELPLWNPLVGMGAPLAANYQSGLFYLPYSINFLIYALAGLNWMAWAATLVVCFHLSWAGIGMVRLLDELGISKLGQITAGLAYSLSGYLIARAGFLSINAASAWLPWVLLAALRIGLGKPKSMILSVIPLTFLLLSGHAQTAWYSVLLGGLWIVYWAATSGKASSLKYSLIALGKYAAAGLLAAGISAVQLLPTLEYLRNSQRAVEYGLTEAMTYSFWPWRFLTLFIPDLFGNPVQGNYWGYGNYWEDAVYLGMFPILLALGILIKAVYQRFTQWDQVRKKDTLRLTFFLATIVLVSFLLALGKNTRVFPFLYRKFPTFSLFQAPTRWSLWAIISLSILAGVGIDQLERPHGRRLYFTRLAAAGCVAVIGGSVLAWRWIDNLEMTFFKATASAGILALLSALLVLLVPNRQSGQKYQRWSILVVLLIGVDLILAGWGLNPGIDKDFYQKNPEEVGPRWWMPADVEYEIKFGKYFLFDSFEPAWEWEDMYRVKLPNLAMIQDIEMVNNFDPLLPGRYQNWIEFINLEPINPAVLQMMDVGKIITFSEDRIDIIDGPAGEGRRLSVAGCNRIIENNRNALKLLQADGSLISNTELVIFSEENPACREGVTGQVDLQESKNGYLKAKVSLDGEGWLFWSQTWYPGWRARIDGGKLIRVFTANYIFQAVPVPAGDHQVEFIYRPLSFIWGSVVSTLSLAIWAGLVYWNRKS